MSGAQKDADFRQLKSEQNPTGRHASLPPGVEPHEDLYALTIAGDCLAPDYRHGETVVIDPRATPEQGDVVVVWMHGEGRKPSIKRLASPYWLDHPESEVSLASIHLEQYNPPKDYHIWLDGVRAMHKVVGMSPLV